MGQEEQTGEHHEAHAFPQVRVVVPAECGTHAIAAAALGPLTVSEPALAREVFGHLGAGGLLLTDRGFTGLELWRAAAAGDADLLWPAKSRAVLPVRTGDCPTAPTCGTSSRPGTTANALTRRWCG